MPRMTVDPGEQHLVVCATQPSSPSLKPGLVLSLTLSTASSSSSQAPANGTEPEDGVHATLTRLLLHNSSNGGPTYETTPWHIIQEVCIARLHTIAEAASQLETVLQQEEAARGDQVTALDASNSTQAMVIVGMLEGLEQAPFTTQRMLELLARPVPGATHAPHIAMAKWLRAIEKVASVSMPLERDVAVAVNEQAEESSCPLTISPDLMADVDPAAAAAEEMDMSE
jgi:hypothetical protein